MLGLKINAFSLFELALLSLAVITPVRAFTTVLQSVDVFH